MTHLTNYKFRQIYRQIHVWMTLLKATTCSREIKQLQPYKTIHLLHVHLLMYKCHLIFRNLMSSATLAVSATRGTGNSSPRCFPAKKRLFLSSRSKIDILCPLRVSAGRCPGSSLSAPWGKNDSGSQLQSTLRTPILRKNCCRTLLAKKHMRKLNGLSVS